MDISNYEICGNSFIPYDAIFLSYFQLKVFLPFLNIICLELRVLSISSLENTKLELS